MYFISVLQKLWLYIPRSLSKIEASLSLTPKQNRVSYLFSDGFSGGLRGGVLPEPVPAHAGPPRPPPKPRILPPPPPRILRLPRNRGRLAGPPPPLRRGCGGAAPIRVGAPDPRPPSRRQVRRLRRWRPTKRLVRSVPVRVLRGGGGSVPAQLQAHFPPHMRGPLDRPRSENVPSL